MFLMNRLRYVGVREERGRLGREERVRKEWQEVGMDRRLQMHRF